nr:PREDICTED: uncharacterized protein LOC103990153 isoform X1 [Musa acuminata subsp. malaccensis]XP_018682968.1 PREDICTED: uncharacterized protein LOC103990153 isoform X1 [Musa acuminata subsp. malaccensis]XP_018682969.1 PREDICTED: uncharacterized protein LOC103990153 isoform X1 [Musa acuminata subsp. malaccensis]XP_018682970.1 PREDICTED: uncharacterized protein LOC103990153 isoform X1 [Musa acuminata subsp. malaccensis]
MPSLGHRRTKHNFLQWFPVAYRGCSYKDGDQIPSMGILVNSEHVRSPCSSICSSPSGLSLLHHYHNKAALISLLPCSLPFSSFSSASSIHSPCAHLCPERMSCRPSRHQRRASQSVFVLPESFSISEAPPMEVGEKKTAVESSQPSSEPAAPSPPPPALPGQEFKEAVAEKYRD